jgi:glycosyltransferase involved in cell wall biosynthesis
VRAERWLLLAGDSADAAAALARKRGAEPVAILTRPDLGFAPWRWSRAAAEFEFDRAVVHSSDWARQAAPQVFELALGAISAPVRSIADGATGELRDVSRGRLASTPLLLARDSALGATRVATEIARFRRSSRSGRGDASRVGGQDSVLAIWIGEPRGVGGSISHISGILDGFRSQGLKVGLVTTSPPPEQLRSVVDDLEVAPPAAPGDRLISEFQRVADNAAIRTAAARLLKRMQPAFVYQRHRPFFVAGAEVATLANTPLVLEWNTSEIWKRNNWEATGPIDRVFDRLLGQMENSALLSSNLIAAVSTRAAEMAVECGAPEERVITVPNAVRFDEVRAARQPRSSAKTGVATIGWVGTFGPWHGAEVLIEAMTKIASDVRLVMVGDGSGRKQCMRLAQELEVNERIEWAGAVPHSDALATLSRCDVLASPHVPLSDRPFFGSPIKIFEYMALGRPIVASKLEQLDDVLDDGRTGRLVTPGDVDELAATIEEILAMPDKGAALGEAALEEARRLHTWNERAGTILGSLSALAQDESEHRG